MTLPVSMTFSINFHLLDQVNLRHVGKVSLFYKYSDEVDTSDKPFHSIIFMSKIDFDSASEEAIFIIVSRNKTNLSVLAIFLI